jgi:NAD(P)H-dependent FMN reductase
MVRRTRQCAREVLGRTGRPEGIVEWNYKPAGFVSFGGLSGGTRSVAMTTTILAGLKMVPILEAVNFQFFSKLMVDGVFNAGPAQDAAAVTMLDELARWADALKVLRA